MPPAPRSTAWLALVLSACASRAPDPPRPDAATALPPAAAEDAGPLGPNGCPVGAYESVSCSLGVATQACRVPDVTAVRIGEDCSDKLRCIEGICAGGARDAGPVRCRRLCESDAECKAAERCQTRSITYTCQTGSKTFELAICLPAP